MSESTLESQKLRTEMFKLLLDNLKEIRQDLKSGMSLLEVLDKAIKKAQEDYITAGYVLDDLQNTKRVS